jgi:4-hydroxy-tetrahydrodipicolinate reductase
MVFHRLGKHLTAYESDLEPLIADRPITTDFVTVAPGVVRGLKQTARGYASGDEFMTLTFIAALEAEGEGDTIKIAGRPNLEVELHGTNGDLATTAIAANAIRRVKAAAPGLITMDDMPMVTVW